ncbi:hypothetical protein D6774_02785 [Candidatus Woesearchaeota archaeon]|nr:MAG: hypothetical protein D6774_02785 [Candidatus Woesearchaeota archaeon]
MFEEAPKRDVASWRSTRGDSMIQDIICSKGRCKDKTQKTCEELFSNPVDIIECELLRVQLGEEL